MKKLILAIATVAVISIPTLRAQEVQSEKPLPIIRKGTISIGTNIGLVNAAMTRISPTESRFLYDVQLQPAIGYFVNNNLMLSAAVHGGVAQGYDFSSEPIRMNSSDIGVSIGGRYYFGNSLTRHGEIRKLRIFAEAGAGITQHWNKWTNTYIGDVTKAWNRDAFVNVGAGMNYFLTPNVALESGLSYNRFFPATKTINDASLQLNLGVRVFLRRK